jgi:hypothetical protein
MTSAPAKGSAWKALGRTPSTWITARIGYAWNVCGTARPHLRSHVRIPRVSSLFRSSVKLCDRHLSGDDAIPLRHVRTSL